MKEIRPAKGWIAIDIETDGDPWTGELLSIAVSDIDGQDVFNVVRGNVPEWLVKLLADPKVGIVEHTLYDARWLTLNGYEVKGPVFDTRVMAHNLDENQPLDLESLVKKYVGHTMDKRLRQTKNRVTFKCDDGKYVPIAEAPKDQLFKYNLEDARETNRLFLSLLPNQPPIWDEQIALTSVLLNMECAGIPIHEGNLSTLTDTYTTRRNDLAHELTVDLPSQFKLKSGDHVAAYLFLDDFELPARYKKGQEPRDFEPTKEGRLWVSGYHKVQGLGLEPTEWTDSGDRPKVDAMSLQKYKNMPWVRDYLDYQKLDKLVGTYLSSFPQYIHDGRLYGTFNQAGTVSGRLSSSNPNLQNIPRRGEIGAAVRGLFQGHLIVADYSQLEPRLMAHFSQDPSLVDAFLHNRDIYTELGKSVFQKNKITGAERDIAKALVLSMGYGAQAKKLSEILTKGGHVTNVTTAAKYLEAMRNAYPRFFEWREEVVKGAQHSGYVETLAGRKRRVDGSTWRSERQAVNSKIQGSAADIVNDTMLLTHGYAECRIVAQVHDELVYEYDPFGTDANMTAGAISGAAKDLTLKYNLMVPLVFEAKVVRSWGDK